MPTVSVTWGASMKPLLLGVLLAITQVTSQVLNSTLHSTLYRVPIAYVDEMVVFTCVVGGSNSMAWTSEEYIGTGGQRIPLSSSQDVGHRESALENDQTVAVLVNKSDTNMVFIISELHIRVESTYQLASVQCVNSGANTETSIDFLLADIIQITCDRMSVCPEDVVTCTCITGNSTSLAWTSNGTRLTFGSNDTPLMRQDVPGSSTFAVLTENSDVNGIRVIMSNITVSISSWDRIILTCENVDHTMPKPMILPIAQYCPMNPTVQVTTPTDQSSCTCSCADSIAAAVTTGAILFVVILVIIIIIVVCIYKLCKSQLRHFEPHVQLERSEAQPKEKGTDKVDAVKHMVKRSGDLKSQNLMSTTKVDAVKHTMKTSEDLKSQDLMDNQNNEIKESENEEPEKTLWERIFGSSS